MTLTDSDSKLDLAFYRKKLLLSMLIPFMFIFLMWLVKIVEILFGLDFSDYGIFPLSVRGLPGIIFAPFIHADFSHLFNNSIPILFLGTALFYFYSDAALKISSVVYILTGVLVWVAGRQAWHIGASGLVYGLASFLFFSGIIRRYFRLIALSLLVVFLYGSMVWGLFPGIYKNISWESHMLGFFSGTMLAVWYRKEGPQEPVHEWLDEEEDGESGRVGEEETKGLRDEGTKRLGDQETEGLRDEETEGKKI